MKKSLSLLLFFVLLFTPAAFAVDLYHNGASITDALSTHQPSKGVWIGVTQSVDLYLVQGWTTFKGATAGGIIPVVAYGARKTAGTASPDAGDILFLS